MSIQAKGRAVCAETCKHGSREGGTGDPARDDRPLLYHKVLDALIDSEHLPLREKVVLELLRNTGARLHEVVLLTVGGYRNEGIAGQARVVDKGSYGREI